MRRIIDREAHFWTFVDKGSPDGCWPWTGGKSSGGYGNFGIGNNRNARAHRYSYELANGPIPDGMVIRHTCDNPPCVNPSHLMPGTQADNVADRDARQRRIAPQGEAQNHAKLTDDAVRDIRRRYVRGVNQYNPGNALALAAEYGVERDTITAAAVGRFWRHLDVEEAS